MNQNPANSQQPANSQNPQQQPPQPIKKVRQSYTLKPQHFQKKNGLQALYEAIQELDLTNASNNVELSMKKIAVILKTWHFQMLPRYDFDYFLQRCKALGNHKFTQAYMTKVRKIHKGEDTWENEALQETDALQNAELDHLNPNAQTHNHLHQTLDKKIQNAMKLVNEIENRQFILDEQNQGRKMQIQKKQTTYNQANGESDSEDDDCEQLLRQMDALQKEKKQLFSKRKEQPDVKEAQTNKFPAQQVQEQVPYVPEGFEDIDYGQQSSYND